MKRVCILLSLCCMAVMSKAQTATSYTFSRTTGTVTTIDGGSGTVSSTSLNSDDAGQTSIPIGFSFTFCGTAYTQLSASSNGWLSLANASTFTGGTAYTNSASNMGSQASGAGFLMAYWDDLLGTSRTVYYQTSGSAPNRVFTFQWGNNTTPWGNNTGSGTAVFQVKLFESSNIVQYVYGTGAYTSSSATIGIGNSGSDYQTLSSQTSTTAGTTFSTGVTGSPAVNTIMTWTPPTCSGTPTAGTLSTTVGSACNSANPTLSVSGATSAGGLSYQWQSSPTGSSWTDVGGATNLTYQPTLTTTTYYRRNITCAAATASTASIAISVNPTPASIVGPSIACMGQPTTLTTTTTGGTWSSDASAITIDPATGVATAASAGTANISYSVSAGCRVTKTLTVNTVVPTVSANASVTTLCAGGSTTLTATPTSVIPGYDMTTIPYSFTTPTSPTTVTDYSSTDDGYATISLPFNFTFWGTTYSTAYIGTNGYISFGSSTSARAVTALPTTTLPAAIVYCLGDLYVTSPGSITYSTVGVAPNRVFVVTFDRISPCCTYGDAFNAQIKLYETTNTIDLLVSTSASGSHSMGIQNAAGTQAVAPAGRNNASYAITSSAPEAYRFAPADGTYLWSPSTFLGTTTARSVVANSITTTPAMVYTVTRTYNGCSTSATATVTVNPMPGNIDGTAVVCEGLTTSLSNTTSGGTWQSGTAGVGAIDASGVLTGIASGTTNISYTLTSSGCRTTRAVTVNAAPAAITGAATVCFGSTTTLANAVGAGTWSSGTQEVASITSGGVITGASAGISKITYALSTGCQRVHQMTVNPLPAINVVPALSTTICLGEGAPLTVSSPLPQISILAQNFNFGLGQWTVTSPFNPGDGISVWHLTSASAIGISGDGSQMLEAAPGAPGASGGQTETILTSPGFSTVGVTAANLTFNENIVSAASSDEIVEVQYSTDGGNTWTLLLDQIDEIVEATSWSVTSPEVSIALPPAALNVPDVRLRWNYKSNYGGWWQIDNIAVKTSLPAVTFTWNTVGSATGLPCPGCVTPAMTMTVTPTTTGPNVYSITANSNCSVNTSVTVSVNPLPAPITGASATLCVGSSIALGNIDAGGAWSSNNSSIAAVNASGEVQGVNTGIAVISYALPNTCFRTVTVYVTPAPAAISGTLHVCDGLTTLLSHAVTGGVWSSGGAVASINPSTGLVTGGGHGNAVITYILPSGCRTMANVTVNELPSAITGSSEICIGQSTTLAATPTGGEWSSGNAAVASAGSASGIISGVSAGTAMVTYKVPTGCQVSVVVTVNALPEDIAGVMAVCEESTTTLTNGYAGGTWSSSNVAAGSVDVNGVVNGLAAGNTDIVYTLPTGCYKVAHVSVNALPGAITGTREVCEGSTTILSSAPTGGIWSGNTAEATVGAGTGEVSGIHYGVSSVTYTLATGCSRVAVITVNALPGDIAGSLAVCHGLTTGLNSTSGGQWTSSNTAIADIDASGVVTGVAEGTARITYTIASTGCLKSVEATVNPLPEDITGTLQVCEGLTTSLANNTPDGTWSTASSGIAAVGTTGIVNGLSAGSQVVTYSLPTGCIKTANVVVNPLPGDISGTMNVCAGLTTNLSNSTAGGSWSGGNSLVATIDGSGVVSAVDAGTTSVTYTLNLTGCLKTAEILVNPLPADIAGSLQVCEGLTTTLESSSIGGIWSADAPGVAGVDAAGVVSGIVSGNAHVTYTLATGCAKAVTVTVNALPDIITGFFEACEGATATLENATPAGSWMTAASAIAHVDMSSGIVTGLTAGTSDISYVLSTGCMRTASFIVKARPADIAGAFEVCAGLTTALTDATTGGAWSGGDALIATVDASGVVSGVAAGSVEIVYTALNGCAKTASISVNALPADIAGVATVCENSTTSLINTTPDGMWTSSATAVAEVGTSSGVVSGGSAGTAILTYALTTGCIKTIEVTVNALPAPIAGMLDVCQGLTTALSSSAGGSWSALSVNAMVDAAGVVTGLAAGSGEVTYTLATGCSRSVNVVVNPLPVMYNVTGGGSYCNGASGMMVGTDGSESGVNYQLYDGSSTAGSAMVGTGTAISFGSYTTAGTYSVVAVNPATGCVSNMAGSAIVAILPLNVPSVSVASGVGATVCAGTLVTYSAAPVNGGTLPAYTWEVNGIAMPATSSSFNYTPANGDIVKVTLTSNASCAIPAIATDMMTMTVDVNQTPVAVVTPASVLSVCQGNNITMTAISMYGGATPVYDWFVNSSPVATGSTFTYVPNNGDLVAALLTSNYACLTTSTVMSNTLTVTTNPVYVPVVSIAVNPGGYVSAGTTVTFTAVVDSNAGPSPLFQWFKNGTAIGGATSAIYTSSSLNNNDSVSCKVFGTNPCGYESFNSVIVSVKSTGVGQLSEGTSNIMLVPNPNKGDFIVKGHLASSNEEELNVEVTNMLGQIVYKAKVTANGGNISERIQLNSDLANGMYLLNLRSGQESIAFHFVLEQ